MTVLKIIPLLAAIVASPNLDYRIGLQAGGLEVLTGLLRPKLESGSSPELQALDESSSGFGFGLLMGIEHIQELLR
jgi:hypothetical protein